MVFGLLTENANDPPLFHSRVSGAGNPARAAMVSASGDAGLGEGVAVVSPAAIIDAGEARAAQVAAMPRTQLIRGVNRMDKMQVKITGKNSDGEYWLHLVGGGQNAGFNLGNPATMVGAALLKAASGQRFVSADPLHAAAPDMLTALKAAIACRMIPTSSAKDGGANAHSEQVRVADMIRAAIAKAEGAGE